jgi:mannose-6-phosphate isomerase-like protein (cupin superfamily)
VPHFTQQGPINLTDAASRMPWSDVEQVLRVRAQEGGVALEIRGLSHAEDGHLDARLSDTVHVVVSGYGLLRCGELTLECTEGNVLFVPGGRPHAFAPLDGEIRMWRISLKSATPPE